MLLEYFKLKICHFDALENPDT